MKVPREELRAAIALTYMPGLGAVTARRLIDLAGSAKQVFDRLFVDSLIKDSANLRLRNLLEDPVWLNKAHRQLEILESSGVSCLYLYDENYPDLLRSCTDAPLVLYKRGNFDLNGQRLLSIVGTRRCTDYGRRFVREILGELSPYGPVIISGFAYGIDIFAQKEANRLGLCTVACLAHGYDSVYPPEHRKYMDSFEKCGGFLTEFSDHEPLGRPNFLRRNRIIAGLSPATVVIESASRGGSLATARMALSYQREVFALPGRYSDRYSKGCNDLIKRQQAIAITSASDLVSELGWDSLFSSREISTGHSSMSLEQKQIWSRLNENGITTRDSLAADLEWPMGKIAQTLLEMEMSGLVRSLPGDRFSCN